MLQPVLMQMLGEIRQDLRAWPGGQSVHAYYEPDLFEPTTMAVILDSFVGDPEIQRLIRLAETPRWTLDAAHELFATVALRLNQAAFDFITEFDPGMAGEAKAALDRAIKAKKGRGGAARASIPTRAENLADKDKPIVEKFNSILEAGTTPKHNIVGVMVARGIGTDDTIRRALKRNGIRFKK